MGSVQIFSLISCLGSRKKIDHALKNYAEKASSWKTIPLCSKFLNSSKLAQPGLRTIASPAKDDKIHISRHQQTRLTIWFAVVSTSIRSNKPFVAILLAWLTASFIFATAKQGMLRPLFTNVFQISTPEYPNLGKFIIDILVFFHVISDGPHKKKKEKGSENSFLGNWITILRNNRAHTVITHLWWFSGSINFSKPFDSCPFKTYKIWNWSILCVSSGLENTDLHSSVNSKFISIWKYIIWLHLWQITTPKLFYWNSQLFSTIMKEVNCDNDILNKTHGSLQQISIIMWSSII